jgi:hypothetical protein
VNIDGQRIGSRETSAASEKITGETQAKPGQPP